MKILVTGGSGFIGTNLTEAFYRQGMEFCNLDLVRPKISALDKYWVPCDIMDFEQVKKSFDEFKPTAVVHLAAETDTNPSKTLEDYRVNTEGTLNILNAIKLTSSVNRFILTSTQFVNQSTNGPLHDEDYAPHTIYGISKMISEQELRKSQITSNWTIIRPTNIWGPWHLRYPFEFWKVLAEGKYFHPGRAKVIRSYGYVGNVVDQIQKILELHVEFVHQKVYYVGDRPIDLYDWVNGFSTKQIGKKVTILPRYFIFSLAVIGNLLGFLNVKFPITISRYKSMTTSNPADMEKTFAELGPPKYSLEEGITHSVNWLREIHPELVKVK